MEKPENFNPSCGCEGTSGYKSERVQERLILKHGWTQIRRQSCVKLEFFI